jgi:glycosyltransferase involved in cell wall biosynthesis
MERRSVLRDEERPDGPLRVVIDLRWMRPGLAGGIENLGRAFLAQLLSADRCNTYTVLLPAATRHDFDLRGRPNFRLVAADGPRRYLRRGLSTAARLVSRRLGLEDRRPLAVAALRRAAAYGAEVSISIPGYIHPDLWALTNVLVVPDIQHEYFPEFFVPRILATRRRLYTHSIRRAAHICAISEFTRQTLIERFGIGGDVITTAHLAADPVFHPASASRGDPQPVLDKHGLAAGQYLLFPGNTWPHKNHRGALEALRILRDAHRLDPLLVCTGSAREAHGEILEMVRGLHLEDRVRFLGYCPLGDMPALYEGAAALFFPSFFEGFGIPLLEAMWCDCPIVSSNAASLPEIAADAALLVDPRSPEEMAHGLNRVLTDKGLCEVLIERGRRRARDFSWTKFSSRVLTALRHARDLR